MGSQEDQVANSSPPKRRMRNFLLDRRFQLKYTGMVVFVTVAVASALGYVAYDYSQSLTESLGIEIAQQPERYPEVDNIQSYAKAKDRQVLTAIVGGILLLALALGITGIVITHRVVGPAYKLRRLLGEVADGRLDVEGRLRRNDELQEVFEAFSEMVRTLRSRREQDVADLDAALQKARDAGVSEDTLAPIKSVRDRLQQGLES